MATMVSLAMRNEPVTSVRAGARTGTRLAAAWGTAIPGRVVVRGGSTRGAPTLA